MVGFCSLRSSASLGGVDIDGRAIIQIVSGTLLFLVLSFTIGRRFVSLLIRIANDHLKSEMAVITVILLIMGLFALVTNAIGVHTVLGVFVGSTLIGRSPILTRHIEEQLRGLIVALFMPVFFGFGGTNRRPVDTKATRAYRLGGGFHRGGQRRQIWGKLHRGTLGESKQLRLVALGCGMNARGSTEVILATLGLAAGALNTTLFTLIVTMALITTLAMPPMLRWALQRVPITANEASQLARMAFEARGYVPNLERLLAAVDQSPSGKLASRCVGLLAGAWGMPTTVVPLQRADAATLTEGQPEAAAIEVAMATAVLPTTDWSGRLAPFRFRQHHRPKMPKRPLRRYRNRDSICCGLAANLAPMVVAWYTQMCRRLRRVSAAICPSYSGARRTG